MKPLGQRLIEAGLITETQLQNALREQARTREYLGRILIRLGYVSEEAVAAALSAQARVKYVDLGQYSPQPEALQLVQEKFAREHHLVPLSYVGKVLVVAMANPLDIITIDELRRMSKGPVEVVGATQSEVLEALDRAYGVGVGAAWDEVVEHSLCHVMGRRGAGGTETDVAQEPPVIRLVESLITRGIQEGATDIHVEPEERLVRNRFRVDGVLRQGPDVPKELQGAVIARIKVMANLDIAENRLPQDGRMDFQFGGRQIDIRVSTFPTIRGENLVLRILDRAKLVLGLEQLGFTPDHLTFFKRVLQNPNGIILVTGPTGSGKTTTLYSAMSYLNAEERNIITVEDPVEYERVDVGIGAALTGHLVFSTLHTNDAAGAVPRLTDMGVAPFLLASALLLVVSQRLVRSICNSCKEEAEPDPALLRRLGLQTDGGDQLKFYRGKGCDKCGNTGYRNRIGIFELLRVGPEMTPLILEKADSGSIQRAARAQGMRTMLEDGIRKALRGTTTLEEVAREALMN